ncbi:MAG TPA: M23 family metallopeptidase, partial [Acidimicrobiales bacterium]|nr:M23 family metallopeptidase [Acidimicrobiales bacterium]
MINSVRRTGGRSTRELMAALRQLVDIGLSPQEAAAIGMGKFPVGGEAAYTDDWLFPRFNPSFHLHEGTDIFAARGTPVRAPADGTVRFTEGG